MTLLHPAMLVLVQHMWWLQHTAGVECAVQHQNGSSFAGLSTSWLVQHTAVLIQHTARGVPGCANAVTCRPWSKQQSSLSTLPADVATVPRFGC